MSENTILKALERMGYKDPVATMSDSAMMRQLKKD
jgi:hypothetical protein